MDDEAFIRILLADLFHEAGFLVVEASDAEEAFALLADCATRVDLLVSDVRMPGKKNGFDLALWVREHRPETKVIMMSAYYREHNTEPAERLHEFLRKPFQPSQMIALAQKVLSEA